MQYFGAEDSIVNTTARVHDNVKYDDCFQFSQNGLKDLRKRFFSVLSVTHTECLTFSFTDLDSMKRDFPFSSKEFFKMMMLQSKFLLYYMLATYEHQESAQRLLVKRSNTEKQKSELNAERVQTLEERNREAVYSFMRGKVV